MTDPLAHAFALTKDGRWADAETACRALAAATPRDPRVHALLARVLAQLGRVDEARAAVDAALALDPACVPALVERASLARAMGDVATRVAALDAVVRALPANAALRVDLGAALADAGRHDEARAALDAALALARRSGAAGVPLATAASLQLGRVAFAQARYADAADAYRAALAVEPARVEAWINLGQCEARLARHVPAAQAFERALALAPEHRIALDGLATALQSGRAPLPMQIDARRRLAALEPGNPLAWEMLAHVWLREQRHEEAAAAWDRAIALDPARIAARWGRFQTPAVSVYENADDLAAFERQWRDGLAAFEALDLDDARVREQLYPALALATNFYLHYLGAPFVDLQARQGRLVQAMLARIATVPARAARAGSGRLRVLFASPFLRSHTVAKLFAPLFLGLDRAQFELSALHFDAEADDVTRRIEAGVDFFATGDRPLQAWIDVIAGRAPDVIVYPDVGMHPMPGMLAALRLAPVQAVLWGHPVTTGLDTVDVFLTSDAMERGGGESDYTERLVRLPNLGTCFAKPSLAPRAGFDVPARRDPDAVHFLFAQSSPKFHPYHDDVFARIAERLPNARFSFVPHRFEHGRARMQARIARAFAARGLDAGKHVHVFAHLAQDQFLALAQSADVNLDSIGWSGGNTTLEILSFDTPTVTLPGALMRSRHTAAILRRIGLDELVATDVDDYVRIAVELGRDATRRAAVRAAIAQRKDALYDDREVVEGFRRFLLDAASAP